MSNQLCQLAGDWTGEVPGDGLIAELKVDGWRALWFPGRDGVSRLWTRNGYAIEGVEHIKHRLRQIEREAGKQLFLDGEFQVDGTLAATKEWCERKWKQGGNAGKLHLFDCLDLEEWKQGWSMAPLSWRKARLEKLLGATGEDWDWRPGSYGADDPTAVQIIPHVMVHTPIEAIALAQTKWAQGLEGIVLKNPRSGYERKRSKVWQKVKVENYHKWIRRAA